MTNNKIRVEAIITFKLRKGSQFSQIVHTTLPAKQLVKIVCLNETWVQTFDPYLLYVLRHAQNWTKELLVKVKVFFIMRSATIAQWICLRLTSYRSGFEPLVHHLRFYQLQYLCCICQTKINKKRPGLAHVKKVFLNFKTQDKVRVHG